MGVVFLGSGCCFKVWVLLGGGPELVGSMISVSGLVSWVKWSLELNGLKRLMVSGAFGLWCRTYMLDPLGCPFWAPGRHGDGGLTFNIPLIFAPEPPHEAKQKEKVQN